MLSKSVMRSPAASGRGGNEVLLPESSICAAGWAASCRRGHAGECVGDEDEDFRPLHPKDPGLTSSPNPLLHEDRLLPADPGVRRIARGLHAHVQFLPIVSPHGHLDPGAFASDAPIEDPATELIS